MKHVIAFLFTLTLGIFASGQECDHKMDSFDRFDNIRLYPPAKVTFIDPRTIDYVIQTRLETRAGTFVITPETVVDKGIKKGDTVWLLYCERDKHLYVLTKLTPEQLKKP